MTVLAALDRQPLARTPQPPNAPAAGRTEWCVQLGRDRRFTVLPGTHGATAYAATEAGTAIFDGTLYNRADLETHLGLSRGATNDADLILRAYQRFGGSL